MPNGQNNIDWCQIKLHPKLLLHSWPIWEVIISSAIICLSVVAFASTTRQVGNPAQKQNPKGCKTCRQRLIEINLKSWRENWTNEKDKTQNENWLNNPTLLDDVWKPIVLLSAPFYQIASIFSDSSILRRDALIADLSSVLKQSHEVDRPWNWLKISCRIYLPSSTIVLCLWIT